MKVLRAEIEVPISDTLSGYRCTPRTQVESIGQESAELVVAGVFHPTFLLLKNARIEDKNESDN